MEISKSEIPKIIAMYLPQFHQIPENDRWWGEGFTEWTNVRKAKPLFEGHKQPLVPYGEYYYDLKNPIELLSQMHMAKEYGLSGFCFYHYWFQNGKKLLEKPVEKLLAEENLPAEFFLCWANEPWTRRWDGQRGSKELLIDQNYGDEAEWEQHFYYLLDFFSRKEYVKLDGRPVFAIYCAEDIKRLEEMLELWNSLSKGNGFNKGLYVIVANRGDNHPEKLTNRIDAIYDFEPFATLRTFPENERKEVFPFRKVFYGGEEHTTFDYAEFCKNMYKKKQNSVRTQFPGFFTGWDNSPRIGERTKTLFENNTSENIKKAFEFQVNKAADAKAPLLLINAWNEWGEGAIMQPDEDKGFGCLEAIKEVIISAKR